MRILLIWLDDSPEFLNLVSSLKQNGHELVYWVANKKFVKAKKEEGKFSGIILHDHWDAWIGIPPNELKQVKFDPPSEELINKFLSAESIILTMMNKHFKGMCVDERKNYYYGWLSYWNGVFNQYKPEAMIISAPPHPGYNYIIYEIARQQNIRVLIFHDIGIAGRMIWYDNIREGSRKLLSESTRNKDKNFFPEDLSEDLRLYYKFNITEGNDATPGYIQEFLKKGSLKNKIILKIKITLKSLKDFTIFKKVPLYFKKLLINNPQKEYHRFYEPRPDFTKKFIYVPLHYQPECSTSPMGGVFANQILMIKILASSLPKDWVIYVKEHPTTWLGFGLNYTDSRYPGYYRQISQIDKVRLIPVKTDTFSLIKQSQAVATVTGTAGWEAALRRKPALVFGYAWYSDCPGVFKVNNVETCRSAIRKIERGYQSDNQSIINYFKALEIASIHGFVENYFNRNKKITKQDCTDNILRVITNELK